jgi:HD superfamily phosphodiesterase
MNKPDQNYLDFKKKVDRVSKTWMPDIIKFLEQLYAGKWLPSHDIEHHKRVWQNAVEICRYIQRVKPVFEQSFYEELILCCFFHDTGLLVDTSEFHGTESKKFTVRFLESSRQNVNFDTTALLDAIEKHDDKNYQSQNINASLLLEILSLADDIDALGAIGLYRYIEIYLVRGIVAEKIPELILTNVEKRFINLEGFLKKYNVLSDPYMRRYNDLIYLLTDSSFPEDPSSLVSWIESEIINIKDIPDKIILGNNVASSCNKRIIAFINKYREEGLNKRI